MKVRINKQHAGISHVYVFRGCTGSIEVNIFAMDISNEKIYTYKHKLTYYRRKVKVRLPFSSSDVHKDGSPYILWHTNFVGSLPLS